MRHAFNAGLLLLVSATPVAAQSMDGMMDDLRRMEPVQNLGTVPGSEDLCTSFMSKAVVPLPITPDLFRLHCRCRCKLAHGARWMTNVFPAKAPPTRSRNPAASRPGRSCSDTPTHAGPTVVVAHVATTGRKRRGKAQDPCHLTRPRGFFIRNLQVISGRQKAVMMGNKI